ncbi:TadE/TadG family type IV pilus assembly protein [Planctomycetota bacterium]
MNSPGNRKFRTRRGSSLVEMAIVLHLLLLLTIGMLEYGWFFLNAQMITNAARHGARRGAVVDATDAEATAELRAALGGFLQGKWTTAEVVTGAGTDPATVATVVVPVANIRLIKFDPLPEPENLRARVVMAKEGATP